MFAFRNARARLECTRSCLWSSVSFGAIALALAAPPGRAQGPSGPLVLCQSGNYSVSVTPDAGTASWPQNTSGRTSTFTVVNTSTDCGDTYTFTYTATGPISGVTLDQTSHLLNPGGSTLVTATYSVGNAGSGQLTLVATGSVPPHATDAGWYTVTATVPPGAPRLDASPYNFAGQDYGRCASACFAAMASRGTVPYFSLDAPRQVALVYNGDRVNPRPFILLNVSPDLTYGSWPTEYQFQVKVNGGLVTFVNGEQTLRFAYTGTAPVRIGGQFDANSYATNVYSMDILVTAMLPNGPVTNDFVTKLVVVNQTSAAVARGWAVGGVQRLYLPGDGSALVVEGDGSAVYFAKPSASFVSPAGEFSTLIPSTLSGSSGWARLYPDSTKVVFNSAGLMTRVLDRFGNRDSVVYDASNRVSTLLDPLNLAITLAYDANGLTSIQDPGGRVTDVVVDPSRRLTTVTDPDNVSTTFGYDASLRLSTMTDRGGNTTTLGYDSQSGTLASVTPPAVEVVNADGSVTTVSPVTSFEPWQKKGVPYGSTGTPVTPPAADTVYARVTDPGSHTTRFTVSPWGKPAVVTDAVGRTDSTRFDANGLPIRLRSAVGAVDSAVYNTSGLPTYTKAFGTPATRIRYAAWGQADSVWTDDGLSGARRFIGANGRVDSVRVAGGTSDVATSHYRYDARGGADSVADPLGHLVQRTWYAGTNGNRSKDSLPGNRVTTYGYDTHGRRTTVSPPGLASATTYYSIINRPDSVRDGVNPVPTRYGYDNLFLTGVTDPKGQTYGFIYNAVGWLTQRTDPVARSDVYKYSRDGELRRWTNRRGQTIEYTYDPLHRPISKSGANTTTDTWAYPSDTEVVASSPVAVDTAVVNRYGQLSRASTLMANQLYTRRYTYTAPGALDSVIPAGAGLTFQARQYIWNLRRGTLTDIKLGTASTAVGHDADGLAASVTLPGGDQVSRSTTALHTTAGITTSAAYSGTVNRSMGLDTADRIRRQIVSPTSGHQYSYDKLGRLVADSTLQSNGVVCDPHNPPPDGDPCTGDPRWTVTSGSAFAYDSAGNRRDLGGTYTPGDRIAGFNGCSYVTDEDGNVTSRTCGTQTVTFTWTAENRLGSLTVGGQTTTYDYNTAGRLVRKTTGGVARHFLWERDNLVAELDGAGTTKIAEYSYYPGLDNLHALIVGGTKYFAHLDGLGNVIALTEETQALARTYQYDGWGNDSGGLDYAGFGGKDRARFKGALRFDFDLYYMRHRWYEPQSGRFLSEDPTGLEGGINPYVFAGNDPINLRDPSGLEIYYLDPVLVEASGGVDWGLFLQYFGGGSYSCCYVGGVSGGRFAPFGEVGGGSPEAGPPTSARTAPDVRVKAERNEFNNCVAGEVGKGFVQGLYAGLVTGAATGWAVSGPIATRLATRSAIVAGALTVEAGGSGAIPAFVFTYAVARAGITVAFTVGGGIVGMIGGAIKGVATAYSPGGCATSLH